MEEWFAAGGLSQEDFELLVKLAARYVYWDVDQFDHWELPTPGGSMFVDFNQSGPTPYGEDPTAYRVLWPSLAVSERGWTVWREDDEGARPVATFAEEAPARALAAQWRPGQRRAWVRPPLQAEEG